MAIWKEPAAVKKEGAATPDPLQREPEQPIAVEPVASAMRRQTPREPGESVIGSGITITGKIDGAGHVRIGGRFEGDVHIQGDLTIDADAKLTGSVQAHSVRIAGEVDGNIEGAEAVELLPTGVLIGDLKAGTLTVAAGSRMRGKVEFGWHEESSAKASPSLSLEARQAS